MAVKYSIEYKDVKDNIHSLLIYDDDYSGIPIEIEGVVFLDHSETGEILNPIKGLGIRVELEANSTLTFSDLYSEYEKDFRVLYFINSFVKFQGWINPEGWFEDFVKDTWKVSFDCIDGLSFLENLSYVDSNGLNYTSQQTALEVIVECLKKTGLEQDIKADVGIVYSGLTESLDILDNLVIDPIRYKKDDDETFMSCKEVLSSVLESLTACIVSQDGEWHIYRPNQLAESDTFSFHHYDYTGTPDAVTPTGTKSLLFELGSEINGFSPHHCSGNQSIRNEKSVGGYRINYKYGVKKGLLDNIYLVGGGTTIDEWTRDFTTFTSIPSSNMGIILYAIPTFPTVDNRNLYSDNMALQLDDLVDVYFKFVVDMPDSGVSSQEYFQYKLICVGATTHYYTGTGWTTGDTIVQREIYYASGDVTISHSLKIPVTGNLRLEFWTPKFDAAAPVEFNVYIYEVGFEAIEEQEDNIEGEIHTLQRTTKPNSKVSDTKEVFNGDNQSSIYVGALFKADGSTLTSYWKRKGVTESLAILRLMGNETLRLKQNTRRVFSGSVYGYFSFLSVGTIDGIPGRFVVTKYEYDTVSNIISAEFKEVFDDELTDVLYQKTTDYGNVVKPTIKG